MSEITIPDTEAVLEYLGIGTGPVMPVVPIARMARAVNVGTLTTPLGVQVHNRYMERILRSFADVQTEVHDLLHSVADQIVWNTGNVPINTPTPKAEVI